MKTHITLLFFFLTNLQIIGLKLGAKAQSHKPNSSIEIIKEFNQLIKGLTKGLDIGVLEGSKLGTTFYKPIKLPLINGEIVYQYTSLMDSSLSKERIYKSVLNWYFKTFPYGHKLLLNQDLKQGQILARGEADIPYSLLLNEFKMKVHFLINCSIRYGRYQVRLEQIEPQDELEEEGSNGKSYYTYKPKDLKTMYGQYENMPVPTDYAQTKMEGIDFYFRNLLDSFRSKMKSWLKMKPNSNF
jgi:hypothetical protein